MSTELGLIEGLGVALIKGRGVALVEDLGVDLIKGLGVALDGIGVLRTEGVLEGMTLEERLVGDFLYVGLGCDWVGTLLILGFSLLIDLDCA